MCVNITAERIRVLPFPDPLKGPVPERGLKPPDLPGHIFPQSTWWDVRIGQDDRASETFLTFL